MPNLFDPYTLKGVTLRNRIAVPPMCQYMAEGGMANDWHLAHYASIARGGAGLVVVEATAVSPEGRISWGDLGLWNDAQAEALRPVVGAMKAAGAVPGIQIGHAGRKASANRPWEGDDHLPAEHPHGWETLAPSALAFGKGLARVPRAMTLEEIQRVQGDTVAAAIRARDLGFQWLQLHMAHGYLAQQFFSPLSNTRTDAYGGSPANRARFLLETFRKVREVWPGDRPLNVRLGVVEFHGDDEALLQESIELLRRMKEEGLDFVDVSLGFNTPEAAIPWGPGFMLPLTRSIRKATGLPVATSWYLPKDPKEADALIRGGDLDLFDHARPILDDPHWPYHAARELGLPDAAARTLPPPYAHWLSRYH